MKTPTTESSTNPKQPIDGRWEVNANPSPSKPSQGDVSIAKLTDIYERKGLMGIRSFIQSAIDEAYEEGKDNGMAAMVRTADKALEDAVAKRDEEVLAECERRKQDADSEAEKGGLGRPNEYIRQSVLGRNSALSSIADFIRGVTKK